MTPCTNYPRSIDPSTGYGRIQFCGRVWYAHRLAYYWATGEHPGKLCVMHSCDNRACYNPEHLSVGTKKQNSEDMVAKGRSCAGEKNGHAKLTDSQVAWIRMSQGEVYQSELARQFGVSKSLINMIQNNKRRQ